MREYRAREKDLLRLKRQARKTGNYYVEAEPRLAFVLRIRGYVQSDSALATLMTHRSGCIIC